MSDWLGLPEDRDAISPDVYMRFLQEHEEVVRDEVTMLGFKAAIEANAELFRGATVLELGCGSGLLSLWAAQQGATRVIAVEASSVCQIARQLVSENGLQHLIKVVQCPVEQLELLVPKLAVDIIISKWMGACLMFNSVLEDVLYARDKWLKPGGSIFPCSANLYMALAEQPRKPFDEPTTAERYWRRYNGFNLSRAWIIIQKRPQISAINVSQIHSQSQLLRSFDMQTLRHDQLSFTAPYRLLNKRQALAKWFVLYFDFSFPGRQRCRISTSPTAAPTQWKQTLFHIDAHVPLLLDDQLNGNFQVIRSPRHLDFHIAWSCHNELVNIEMHRQSYRMQSESKDRDIE